MIFFFYATAIPASKRSEVNSRYAQIGFFVVRVENEMSVQKYIRHPVLFLSYISWFAFVRQQIDSTTTRLQKKISRYYLN